MSVALTCTGCEVMVVVDTSDSDLLVVKENEVAKETVFTSATSVSRHM